MSWDDMIAAYKTLITDEGGELTAEDVRNAYKALSDCQATDRVQQILNLLQDDYCPTCGSMGSWLAEEVEAEGIVYIQYRCPECGPVYQYAHSREAIDRIVSLQVLAEEIQQAWMSICRQVSAERGWIVRGEMPFHCGRPGRDAGIRSDGMAREFFCERCGLRFYMPIPAGNEYDRQWWDAGYIREMPYTLNREYAREAFARLEQERLPQPVRNYDDDGREGTAMSEEEEWAADCCDVFEEILSLGIPKEPAWEAAPAGRGVDYACGLAGVEREVFVKSAARFAAERYPDRPGLEAKLLKRWRLSRTLPGMISTGWEECKARQAKED